MKPSFSLSISAAISLPAGALISAAIFALALVAAIPAPAFAQGPAPAASALSDPESVDWDARFEGARAAKDVNAFIQILELAPLPRWTRVLDKSVEELVKLSDTPNIETPGEKPGATRSFLSIAVRETDSETGALLVRTETPVPQGRLIYAHFAKEFPAETASMSLVLRPPVPGVSAELADMTLVKSGGKEFVTASALFLIGPSAAPGEVSMTGSLVAKTRSGGIAMDIPLEVEIIVSAEKHTPESAASWFKSALAHRWASALTRTGEVKTDWINLIFSGSDPETDRKNRLPNARRHELVAFMYGEMLRQMADYLYAQDGGLAEAATPSSLAAEEYLIKLESLELRRAQYIAARAGDALPAAIEGGYWWTARRTGRKFGDETKIDPKTVPPRYRD